MAKLPTIVTPTFEVELPSTKTTHKFRPFLVKEEKILMMAQQMGDNKAKYDAICTIISNCVEKLPKEPEQLPMFDVEWLFLHIRSKSMGESVVPSVTCTECKFPYEFSIDLTQAKCEPKEGHTNKIMLTEDIGITLRYPTINIFKKYNITEENKEDVTTSISLMVDCIEQIFTKDECIKTIEQPRKEIEAWVDALPPEVLKKIQGFFESLPKTTLDVVNKCPSCGKEEKIHIEGFESFFSYFSAKKT